MKFARIILVAAAALAVFACGSTKVEGSKEVRDLLPTKGALDSTSYLLGVNIGQMIKNNDFGDLNYNEFIKGIKDFVNAKGDNPQDSAFLAQFRINPMQMGEVIDGYLGKRKAYTAALNGEKATDFVEKFKAEHPEALTTESGIVYVIEEPGAEGTNATSDRDTVWVNYKGTRIDGSVFDENENINFTLNRVIKGWSEGMKLIGEGGKATLVIPGELAYGERGNRTIAPNSTLVFDVELLKVGKYVAPVEEPAKPVAAKPGKKK